MMNRLLEPEQAQEIQKKANELLAEYQHISDPYELVSKIASDHGVRIMETDLYDLSGALRKEDDHWVIYINRSDSQQRKLFTVAHELGHFFVHRDFCDEFVDGQFISRNEQERYAVRELEANEFAGGLIMPESRIRQRIAGEITEDTFRSLAKSFGVSTIAMETRLRNLGYAIPSRQ